MAYATPVNNSLLLLLPQPSELSKIHGQWTLDPWTVDTRHMFTEDAVVELLTCLLDLLY